MENTSELLKSQLNAGETSQNNEQCGEELVKRVYVENTGFVIVGTDKGWAVTLGKYRLGEWQETLERCQKEIEDKSWDLIIALMGVVMQENEKEQDAKKEQQRKAYEEIK